MTYANHLPMDHLHQRGPCGRALHYGGLDMSTADSIYELHNPTCAGDIQRARERAKRECVAFEPDFINLANTRYLFPDGSTVIIGDTLIEVRQ